jgi:hypothetical protein
MVLAALLVRSPYRLMHDNDSLTFGSVVKLVLASLAFLRADLGAPG